MGSLTNGVQDWRSPLRPRWGAFLPQLGKVPPCPAPCLSPPPFFPFLLSERDWPPQKWPLSQALSGDQIREGQEGSGTLNPLGEPGSRVWAGGWGWGQGPT